MQSIDKGMSGVVCFFIALKINPKLKSSEKELNMKAKTPKDLSVRVWTLVRIYLLCQLLRAKYTNINYYPPGDFPLTDKIIKAKVKRNKMCICHYDILVKAVKRKEVPKLLAREVAGYDPSATYAPLPCYKNGKATEVLRGFFKLPEKRIFQNFISRLWQEKEISIHILGDKLTILENDTPVVSTFLLNPTPNNFCCQHAANVSREFFVWAITYFNILKPDLEDDIQEFEEGRLAKY